MSGREAQLTTQLFMGVGLQRQGNYMAWTNAPQRVSRTSKW